MEDFLVFLLGPNPGRLVKNTMTATTNKIGISHINIMTKPPPNIPELYIAIPLLVNTTDHLLQLFQLQIEGVVNTFKHSHIRHDICSVLK